MKQKYVLVGFPEIQDYMDHNRWNECILCISLPEHPCEDSTYAVPEDLYDELNGNIKQIW